MQFQKLGLTILLLFAITATATATAQTNAKPTSQTPKTAIYTNFGADYAHCKLDDIEWTSVGCKAMWREWARLSDLNRLSEGTRYGIRVNGGRGAGGYELVEHECRGACEEWAEWEGLWLWLNTRPRRRSGK